jgi:hypothetical protein
MSTYYYFYCKDIKIKNGFFSRQAWGWGNFDIIASFKWLCYCIENYGANSIEIISEHDQQIDESLNNGFPYIAKLHLEFLIETRDIFPCSNDWNLNSKDMEPIETNVKEI